MSRRYSIPEQRRCRGCHRKSYTKFLGDFMLYSYHCKKCGTVHTICRTSSLELAELQARSPQKWALLTVNDVINILESSPREGLSLNEFNKRFEKISERTLIENADLDRATASMLDIFRVFANRYNKVFYNTALIRLLRLLDDGEWHSLVRIRKKYGSKYVGFELDVTRVWYLTNKSKQGREVLYKITSKGKAFLTFLEKAKRVLPEGTSIFSDEVSRLSELK